jgi:hypothetical protein
MVLKAGEIIAASNFFVSLVVAICTHAMPPNSIVSLVKSAAGYSRACVWVVVRHEVRNKSQQTCSTQRIAL